MKGLCPICGGKLKNDEEKLEDNSRKYNCYECGRYVIPETLYLAFNCSFYETEIPYSKDRVREAIKNYLNLNNFYERSVNDRMISCIVFYWGSRVADNKYKDYVQLDGLCSKVSDDFVT